ncbi:hypothetical protein JY94_09745 [Megasphaera elsdenii]|nr:hypothetical protein JY94_09745 [Megasphaera elsdenii]
MITIGIGMRMQVSGNNRHIVLVLLDIFHGRGCRIIKELAQRRPVQLLLVYMHRQECRPLLLAIAMQASQGAVYLLVNLVTLVKLVGMMTKLVTIQKDRAIIM